mmetsp:Transcript_21026/g.34727  ORF Transcript_21026/g.34727 Transcript_21026/m.34727 type:complete len:102 (-) Transcript_21026:292-597(-)
MQNHRVGGIVMILQLKEVVGEAAAEGAVVGAASVAPHEVSDVSLELRVCHLYAMEYFAFLEERAGWLKTRTSMADYERAASWCFHFHFVSAQYFGSCTATH